MWSNMKDEFDIQDEPCNYFMKYSKDIEYKIYYDKKKKNIKELVKNSYWLQHLVGEHHEFCVGGCGKEYDENNRMHDQVENVLMISHLERNQLNIEKTKQDINEIINLAISHVSLIVDNKNGNIFVEKNANNSFVIGNETHLINVMVNILDNAIKYNENSPEILIKTQNIGNRLIIEIKDNGIGMNKSVQSKIFEKFYRKQTGDLHNVKGDGLGLAYVKRIITFHNGNITVDSIVDKGSTFCIQLDTLT